MTLPPTFETLAHWCKTPVDTVMLDTLPRMIRSELSVRSFGVKLHSSERLEEDFQRYGFAFVVAGSGHLYEDRREWHVQAPAVLHHRAGHHYRQIPDPSWDEFYITFSESFRPVLEQPPWNLFKTPVFNLHDAQFMLDHFRRLFDLFQTIPRFGAVDRFDLEATELLLDLAAQLRVDAQTPNDVLSQVRHYLESHYLEKIDYAATAARFGFSLRHLRRQWQQQYHEPPSRYVLKLQMDQAQYLLSHTDMRIGEIADLLQFADALYFSRKFRQYTGLPPSEFRAMHRNPSAGGKY